MSISHRTHRLRLLGPPAVEKLQNSRFRLTFDLQSSNPREDWYNANKANIFADFGSLQSAEFSTDGAPARTGEAYSDMRLVEASSQRSGDDYIIRFVYETLTSSFVQTKDDTVDHELNGLRRVTRTSIAAAGTDFQKTVGTTSISHQIDTESAVTCFLASYEINDTDSFREVEEVYIQAGELARDVNQVSAGVLQTTFQTLVTDPSTVSGQYVLSREIDNFGGLQRITTSVISKSDGTTLTDADGSEKLVTEKEEVVNFTFPGVVDIIKEGNHFFPTVRSPVQCKVKADVYTYYQTSNDIVSGDFTKESSLGLWNPSEWCQKITTIGSHVNSSGNVVSAYYNSQGLRGCRTRTTLQLSGHDITLDDYQSQLFGVATTGDTTFHTGGSIIDPLGVEETVETLNGKSVYSAQFDYIYDVVYRLLNVGNGVLVRYGPNVVNGRTTVNLRYNSSGEWEIVQIKTLSDPNPTDSGGWPASSKSAYYRSRTETYHSGGYTNVTSSTTTILGKSTSTGAASPDGLTYETPAGASTTLAVGSPSNEITAGAASSVAANVEGVSITKGGFWIEGRQVVTGSTGKIVIKGGPPDPLGKKYTLDVSLKRAFTDKNGLDVFEKKITIATCTPI
jgi:hypothetical protein